MTITGVVTSPAGLIDSEGRRVTVQDKTGAILLRYPEGETPAPVGRTVRATGEVGTWYDTRQLESISSPRTKRKAAIKPATISDPPGEADEWMLVRVWVIISDVERDGDSWRAEAAMRSGESLPIVGLTGSGIDGELLEPGRQARITGVVRRAHPSAGDRRFAIAPRWRKDIRLGELVAGEDADEDQPGDGEDAAGTWSPADDPGGDGVLTVTLGTLEQFDQRIVRVGGRVEDIAPDRLTLDDGTASGIVRIPETVAPLEPRLRLGEVVNATGRVTRRAGRPAEVVVESAADLRRAAGLAPSQSHLDEALLLGPPTSEQVHAPSIGGVQAAAAGAFDPAIVAGLATLGLLCAGCFVVAGWLAWRTRRGPAPTAVERSLPSHG